MATMSYVSGTSDVPLIGNTIGQQLEETARRFPDGLALVVRQQNVRLTWHELDAAVDKLAAGLLALGLAPGDRVGIWSPNNVEWVLTQLATARTGMVLVCINPAYRLHELDYALNKAGCAALITATAFKSSDYAGMLLELLPELTRCPPGRLEAARVPALRTIVQIGALTLPGALAFADVLARGRADEKVRLIGLADTVQFDDPVNIQFTSGTTGAPKGATLTHHNLLNNGYVCGATMRYTAEDRLCIPVPLYHCFGNSIGVMACISHATAMVFPGEGFDPLAVLETVAEERCTSLYGVPTMFIAEMAHPDFEKFDLTSLRTGMMAGSPCPIEVMRRAMNLMHLSEITIGYGMTETSPVSFQTTIEAPIERRVSTVGTIHPHLEAKVIDAEGRVVPVGTPGELCTRGYAVMLGYWEDDERTDQAIDRAGWMHTGDLATIDAEGYCAIVGRIKDMVIRGGENVYPREVEEFLYKHPKIFDVQVFGVPDPKYGEEICAWIKLRDGETMTAEEVRAFCRDQIAHFKVPRHIRFVNEFPMTVTGKIQKYLMREAMTRDLAGGAQAAE
jgi:fatty-acyl-CoA synthase